jgi:50S ribosomal protein L16 3-hydroxylase
MASTLLGGLSPRTFLRRHWQKRPLLVRGAFPAFRDPVTPARLLALAARAGVESRLVMEKGGEHPWQLVPGPLSPARLRRLGRSHWTVLVHGVDARLPAVADLVDLFDFLPRWRVDDVLVSLAAPQGSVGPHVDTYDVFLLQGRGRRRWRIAERFVEAYRPGLDLRILRGFRPEREWVLEPGDMLYLPPGVAHHGVALDECLTYSIGLRAPAEVDLVAGYLQRVVASVDRSRLYADPDLEPAREPGEIPAAALASMRAIVVRAATGRRSDFARFAGEHLTEARTDAPREVRALDRVALRRALSGGAALVRRPGARIAFVRQGEGVLLFADGRPWPLARAVAAAAAPLTRRRRVPAEWIRPYLRRQGFLDLLAALIRARVFRVERSRAPTAGRDRGRRGSRRAAGSRRTAPRR